MILNRQRRWRVAQKPLQRFARELARALRLEAGAFEVALVSDPEIARLNRRYRRKAAATDVLAFPLEPSPRTNGSRGEVVVSVDTARRNARRFGHGLEEEIKLLILHGVLHLVGYDHETDQGQMTRREHQLRRRLGLE